MLKFPEHTVHGVDIYLCSLHLAVMENTDLCDREHVGLSKKNRNIQQREVWGVVARMIRPAVVCLCARGGYCYARQNTKQNDIAVIRRPCFAEQRLQRAS